MAAVKANVRQAGDTRWAATSALPRSSGASSNRMASAGSRNPRAAGIPVEGVAHVAPDVPPVLVGCLAVGAGRHPAYLGRVARRVGSEPDRGDAAGPRGRIGYVCLVEVGGGRDDLRPPHRDALGLVGDLRRGLSQADRAGTDHRYRSLPRWLPGSLPGVGSREGRDVGHAVGFRLEAAAARSGDRCGGARTGG